MKENENSNLSFPALPALQFGNCCGSKNYRKLLYKAIPEQGNGILQLSEGDPVQGNSSLQLWKAIAGKSSNLKHFFIHSFFKTITV